MYIILVSDSIDKSDKFIWRNESHQIQRGIREALKISNKQKKSHKCRTKEEESSIYALCPE